MNKRVIIIGNGGHASVLTEILLQQQVDIIGFTAPTKQKNEFQLVYLGDDEAIKNYSSDDVALVMGLGMIRPKSWREKIYCEFKEQGYSFLTVVHPSAVVSPSVYLGEGVQVMAGAIIQTNTKIADNTIVNTGAIVDHDGQIGSHVHIAPGTKISGNVSIGRSTHIGTGVTIIHGIDIGTHTLIGAGSVVVKNIGSEAKAFGVPAKEVT